MEIHSKLRETYRNLLHQFQRGRRFFRLQRLSNRWNRSRSRFRNPIMSTATGFSEDAIGVYVINLKHREDRLRDFSDAAFLGGIEPWERVEALFGKHEEPRLETVWANSIACSLSHNRALQQFEKSRHQVGVIFEDDVALDIPWSEVKGLIGEFFNNPGLDVLCLSYRARGGSVVISENLRLVVGAVGRGAYVVKRHMVGPLQTSNLAGVPKLMKGNRKGKGDVMWGRLQRKGYFFAAPRRPVAHQREGFSDIEQAILGRR